MHHAAAADFGLHLAEAPPPESFTTAAAGGGGTEFTAVEEAEEEAGTPLAGAEAEDAVVEEAEVALESAEAAAAEADCFLLPPIALACACFFWCEKAGTAGAPDTLAPFSGGACPEGGNNDLPPPVGFPPELSP